MLYNSLKLRSIANPQNELQILTVAPKPRAEGSNPSAPAIKGEQKRCKAGSPDFSGAFKQFSSNFL